MAERRPPPTGSHGQPMPGHIEVPLVSHSRILHPPVLAGQNRPSVVNEWLFEQERDGFRTEIKHIVADHGSLAYVETIHRVQQIVPSQSLLSVAPPVAQPIVQPVAQPTTERRRKRKRAHKRGKRGGAGRRDDHSPPKNAQPAHQFLDGSPRCDTCGTMHGGECKASRRICYHCRKPGHFVNMCPERDQPQNQQQLQNQQQQQQQNQQQQQQNQQRHDGECRASRRICYHCRKRGHFVNMCPERDQPQNQQQQQNQQGHGGRARVCALTQAEAYQEHDLNKLTADEPTGG